MSDEKEVTAPVDNVKQRRLTPEVKAAIARYIPITADPIDRFTPVFLKREYPPERWPVIRIRKPGSLDLIQVMERTEAARKAAPESEIVQPAGEGELLRLTPAQMIAIYREAVRTWKERVEGFDNLFALDKNEIKFQAESGIITDFCLNQVPVQTLLDVHYRYDALFNLTELEQEGLGSSPASA